MKFVKYLLLLVCAFSLMTTSAQETDPDKLFDDDNEYMQDFEAELLSLDMLQQEDRSQRTADELAAESEQATHLRDKLIADNAIFSDENKVLVHRIERWTAQQEAYNRIIKVLNEENEMLLSENDDLSESKEEETEDETTIEQNKEAIAENEKEIGDFEIKVNELEEQINEATETLEANDEAMQHNLELVEACEWVISTNETLLKQAKP